MHHSDQICYGGIHFSNIGMVPACLDTQLSRIQNFVLKQMHQEHGAVHNFSTTLVTVAMASGMVQYRDNGKGACANCFHMHCVGPMSFQTPH